MRVAKPLQLSLLQKVFELDGKQRLAVAVLLGFPLDGGEPLLEADLWNVVGAELGGDGILDIGMPKPNGEVLLIGKYFAPEGKPVKADRVRMKVGSIDKSLLVFGNRYWRAVLGPSEPEPFRVMELDYSNAFGGPGFARNPVGKGMAEVDVFGEMRLPLPNLEDPDRIMTSSSQRPEPAGFAPLDQTWEFRAGKFGTYDEKWLTERWPGFPEDLDWNAFNAAPQDQWVEEFFAGGEPYELVNMHPDKRVLKGQLPAFRTRCFIQRAGRSTDELDEIAMRPETVWLFPHAETGVMLYRGVIDVKSDDASDLWSMVIGYEELNEPPRERAHYATALANRIDPDLAWKYDLTTADLIPPGATCGYGTTEQELAEMEALMAAEESADTDELDPKEQTRKELTALSLKLATLPGAEEEKARVDQAILDLDLPPLYPRAPCYERIDQLRAEKKRAENLRESILREGGDPASVEIPDLGIESIRAQLDEPGLAVKDSYREQAHLLEEGRAPHSVPLENLRSELLQRLKRKENVTQLDFAGLDLSNEDLSGADLSGCYLEGVNLSGATLAGANLEGAILAFADLKKCNLSGANLAHANLGGADLRDATFDRARMTGAILSRSDCSGARLTGCDLTDADFFETYLTEADLSGSNLTGADFSEIHIAEAIFRDAVLTGSSFQGCLLDWTDFSGATLDESNWIDCSAKRCDFSGAHMKNARFTGQTDLRSSKFVGAMLENSSFREADLHRADFSGANLTMCDFGDAKAQQARFAGSSAKLAQFIGTDLTGSDLSFTNLMEASLMKARLTSAKLNHANCFGAEFMNATVGGTDFAGANLTRTKLEQWRPGAVI